MSLNTAMNKLSKQNYRKYMYKYNPSDIDTL